MFAEDWIRTADLWNWKRPLYQLSHNHCPMKYPEFFVPFCYSANLPICIVVVFVRQKYFAFVFVIGDEQQNWPFQ